MTTYSVTLNERSAFGKSVALHLRSLEALGVMIEKLTPIRRGSYYRSQEDIRAGRVYEAKDGRDMLNQILG